VYLLHGGGASNFAWTGGYLGNIKAIMDRLVDARSVREMIFVMPSAQTKYITAWYTNSPVAGNWEDFITHDLVQYIDDTYRTLAQAGSRGIGGHSVGGAEALRLAMKFPKVFTSVYGLSSSPMDFNHTTDLSQNGDWIQAVSLDDVNRYGGIGGFAKFYFAGAASFSPNPDNPPFFVDLPFELVDGRLERIEPIWEKWLKHDPVAMVDSYETNLLELAAIHFDCGTSDSVLSDSRAFDAALTSLGIPYVYEEYPGTHTSGIPQRIETKVLLFFSSVLAFEMLPTVSVQSRGKLATTWGSIKNPQ
jgi:S-formylglutathione hydrolase FrmB